MQVGFKLIAEAFGPKELVRQAVEAEQAGFDFVEISDHFHPWLTEDQGHSPFACGPDVSRHLEVAQEFVDAGFDHFVLTNAGPDQDGFFRFFADELADRFRALTPDPNRTPPDGTLVARRGHF